MLSMFDAVMLIVLAEVVSKIIIHICHVPKLTSEVLRLIFIMSILFICEEKGVQLGLVRPLSFSKQETPCKARHRVSSFSIK